MNQEEQHSMNENEFLIFINKNFKITLDEYRLIKNILAYTKQVSKNPYMTKEILSKLFKDISYITNDLIDKIYFSE